MPGMSVSGGAHVRVRRGVSRGEVGGALLFLSLSLVVVAEDCTSCRSFCCISRALRLVSDIPHPDMSCTITTAALSSTSGAEGNASILVTNMTLTSTTSLLRRPRGCHGPVVRAQSKMPGKLLLCRANSEDFGRKLFPRFVLSDDLYKENTSDPLPLDSTLLLLPFELLGLVFSTLDDVASQISLALTCKRMALVARDLDLRLSSYSAKYAGYLPRQVFDVPVLMKSLTTWMPPRLRLCDHCLTHRPCAQTYWSGVDGCEKSNFWITKTGWMFAEQSWQKQVHNICPACHVSCTLSDYVDCDGCRALGRLGDIDWSRVSDHWKRRTSEELSSGSGSATSSAPSAPVNHWDLTG